MIDVEQVYDAFFFSEHLRWKEDYNAMAAILLEILTFDSVLDIGCGNGYLIEKFQQQGKKVRGLDGSSQAIIAAVPELRPFLSLHDLRTPMAPLPSDLVICTEVAEHLEPEFADQLVTTVCESARHTVFFGAATPGQQGHWHVNEQPHEYWDEKFKHNGFTVDVDTTSEIRKRFSKSLKLMGWFPKNSTILRR